MPATLYTFLIPREYNDGSLVSVPVRQRIEGWLLDFGGGFSRRDQDGNAWRNNDTGQVYRDERVSEYTVLHENPTTLTNAVAEMIARDAAGLLDQDAVLWYRTDVAAHGFVEAS